MAAYIDKYRLRCWVADGAAVSLQHENLQDWESCCNKLNLSYLSCYTVCIARQDIILTMMMRAWHSRSCSPKHIT